MNLGDWYRQGFRDQTLYFLPLSEQKNGGYAGVLVTVDEDRPRSRPRAKRSSVRSGPFGSAAHYSVLWRYAPLTQVPGSVIEAARPLRSERDARRRAHASSSRDRSRPKKGYALFARRGYSSPLIFLRWYPDKRSANAAAEAARYAYYERKIVPMFDYESKAHEERSRGT